MKIINKEVDIISFQCAGDIYPTPIKMRYHIEKQGYRVIKITNIKNVYEEKKGGNKIFRYICEYIDNYNNSLIPFEIEFYKEPSIWVLYKI